MRLFADLKNVLSADSRERMADLNLTKEKGLSESIDKSLVARYYMKRAIKKRRNSTENNLSYVICPFAKSFLFIKIKWQASFTILFFLLPYSTP